MKVVPAFAQTCGQRWLPGYQDPAVGDNVAALIAWDPDGSGPHTPRLVAGGSPSLPNGIGGVAVFDPDVETWLPLGLGVYCNVYALTATPSGDLIAGGYFTSIDGVTVNNVARWNGMVWSPLGSGVSFAVQALAVMPNGDLIAGGSSGIARWNGVTWSSVGGGLGGISPFVRALVVLPDGDLIAAGGFQFAGGVAAKRIARWDGTSWYPLGSGFDTYAIESLAVLSNGDIVAGGEGCFYSAGVCMNAVARWDGTSWANLGVGLGGSFPWASALTVLPSGDLVVGGLFQLAGGTEASNIARWDGIAWSPLGSGTDGSIRALVVLPNGELAAGGSFSTAGEHVTARFARYSFTGIPTVALQPEPVSIDGAQTVTLSATPSRGYSNVSAQWYKDGVAIADGPRGASPGGGAVSGASMTLPSPADGTPAILTITNAQPSDSGVYTAVFTNACGSVTSAQAVVTVTPMTPECPSCPADYDQDGGVTGSDIGAFFIDFESGAACADVDQDGGVTGADIGAFFVAYEAGGC